MSLSEILNSLDESWDRDYILLNIKRGKGPDEIVNQFLKKNERQIKELNSLLGPEDFDLFNQVQLLSTCEYKLINKIKNLNHLEKNDNNFIINQKKFSPSHRAPSNRISSLMINWSNKFVVIALITLSAIALSKQAWA